ncbi:MAG: cupredoxin domain-containing protein [Gammaproteobacteria bacterium]
MKAILPMIAGAALVLLPSAWAASAQGASGKPVMQSVTSMQTEASAWGHPGKADAVDRTIRIEAEDNMRFVPAKLTVKAGSTVKFVITNTGKIEHELVLGPVAEQHEHEKEMQEMMHSGKMHMEHSDPNEVELAPGATKTLIWTFTKPGTYQYGCHEPGHYAAGMYGTLTVVKEP